MIIPLAQAGRYDELGGKAKALADLQRAGFAVPPAWIIRRSVFRAYLLHNGLSPSTTALADAVLVGQMPCRLVSPAPCVAVRSSGQGEDGDDTSNAGRYQTVLGVTPAGFEDAVRKVWSSWIAGRPRGAPLDGMTVLIQQMVDARVAGVLFTTNPVTGSWAEMVVEAVCGLGAPLVDGTTIPDRYVLSRGRRLGARSAPRVVLEEIRTQDTELVLGRALAQRGPGGLVTRPTDAPHARKLLREDLVALGKLGLALERAHGRPQDVEWAMDRAGAIHILQSRPITTQHRLPRGDATLWTRRFIGERFPTGVTPFTWSLIGPALDHFIAYPETARRYLGGEPALRVVHGHPYVNVTVFRHLAFKVPGAPPPRFMLDFFPPAEEAAWIRRHAAPPDFAVYASILRTTLEERRWERFRWNPATNVRAWDTFRDTLETRFTALRTAPLGEALRDGDALVRDYIKIHVTSLLFANMAWELLSPALSEQARPLILRPWGGSITRRVDAALGDVGRGLMDMDEFLALHGHRSTASWEVWAPRLREDLAGTWATARVLAESQPAGITARLAEEAAETQKAVGALPPLLRKFARLASEYLRLREEQRYTLDKILWELRTRLTELAPSLGLPAEALPWLTIPELLDLPEDAARRAERRRAIDPSAEPPDFLSGDAPLPPSQGGRRLQGLGVSPGTARGTARVLRRVEEAPALRTGEILVTRSTDPAWTPVFSRAAGLVLELGSQLSHGAVVAREYGLPAVANISGATQNIPDGAEIELDGRSGTVWIL